MSYEPVETIDSVSILWQNMPRVGSIAVTYGELASIHVSDGHVDNGSTVHTGEGSGRWTIDIANAELGHGIGATRVSVLAGKQSFTFWLRDVAHAFPIFIPIYGVAVVAGGDARDYGEIADACLKSGRQRETAQWQEEPEAGFDDAAKVVRDSHAPTWLGLSRNMHLFEIDWQTEGGYWGVVRPRMPKEELQLPEAKGPHVEYVFTVGRGTGCVAAITRQLESGCLPIIHSHVHDAGIDYRLTAFVDCEAAVPLATSLRGTPYLVADSHCYGASQTDAQKQQAADLLRTMPDTDLPMMCLRIVAKNDGSVPAYAWFQAPNPQFGVGNQAVPRDPYQDSPGLGSSSPDHIFCVARFNGKPLRQLEMALLIQPGEEVCMEYYLPHTPAGAGRARALLNQSAHSFDTRYQQVRTYWQSKLDRAASIAVPEERIRNMVRAGLLHLDLITYGQEPESTLAPTVGRYSPIGTESAPIIQFYDMMGRHDLARRSLNYFVEKQRPDGQMQNYQHYESETGPVLWTMGEHFRYTRDVEWVRNLSRSINQACDYLINQRNNNKIDALRGKGYGLLSGAVADPVEKTHYYMNSGYACLGLSRAAEMLTEIDPVRSRELSAEANALKHDLVMALCDGIARGPVIPLEDGTWIPTVGPYVQATGALALLAEKTIVQSHSSFGIHDSALGALYCIFQEIIEPDSLIADILLESNRRLTTTRNVAPSQPYYCRHDYAHLRRGEIKAFLQCYYNTLASQADRETFTFWEHQYRIGVHKTHEEAWFLLQTRWMLLMEAGEMLHLLPGIPRAWVQPGNPIRLTGLASYFGPIDLRISYDPAVNRITAHLQGANRNRPQQVRIRLPHPFSLFPRQCIGGVYDQTGECVRVDNYTGGAVIQLQF